MSIFKEELKIIQSFPQAIEDSIKRAVKKFDFVLVDYVVNDQMDKRGEDGEGEKIKPAYSRITIKIKQAKGQPTDRVTLHDTGDFHASVEIILQDRQFKVVSNVPHDKKIEEKYGNKVLGIQKRNLKEFVNKFLIPEIKKGINDKLTKSVTA